MRTYEEVLSLMDSGWRVDDAGRLNFLRQVNKWLGQPDRQLRIVHVVGTNGKGSVVEMTARILEAADYQVGTFTSPALFDAREQVQLNHHNISKSAVVHWYEHIRTVLMAHGEEPAALSAFEYWTFMALLYFADAHVDVAIIEAGLGGKQDATHVISRPAVVAGTPISLDHMQWLGDTLEAIATNKAAVIQPGSRVVSAQQEPRVTAILQHATQQAQATWQAIDVPVEILVDTPAQLRLQIAGVPYELGLRGQMQAENVRLVWQILAQLDLPTTPENRQLGLSQATLFGRLTVTGQVIYDGAHNPAGAQQLANELDRWGLRGHVILILGMLADKDTTAIQAALTPLARQVIGVTADNQRAMLAADFAQQTATLGEAMTQAKQLATATDWIVVAGSFYTIKGVITHGDLASEHDAFI